MSENLLKKTLSSDFKILDNVFFHLGLRKRSEKCDIILLNKGNVKIEKAMQIKINMHCKLGLGGMIYGF